MVGITRSKVIFFLGFFKKNRKLSLKSEEMEFWQKSHLHVSFSFEDLESRHVVFSVGVVKKHRHQNWGIWCERHVFTKLIELDYDNNNKETEAFSKSSPTKSVATADILLQLNFCCFAFWDFSIPSRSRRPPRPRQLQVRTAIFVKRQAAKMPKCHRWQLVLGSKYW